MFYVYILFSKAIDKYYIGHSINPWERVIQHNNNTVDKYTGKSKDWELMAVFEVSENRADAMDLEKFIKKQKSRNLIEKLIFNQNKFDGKLARLVRVPHVRD